MSQAGLEHYEFVQVAAVEDVLATLMRRCAALPEKAPPSDAPEGAKSGGPRQPSESILPKDMKLPRFMRKASIPHHVTAVSCQCRKIQGREHAMRPWESRPASLVMWLECKAQGKSPNSGVGRASALSSCIGGAFCHMQAYEETSLSYVSEKVHRANGTV